LLRIPKDSLRMLGHNSLSLSQAHAYVR
jgi:hypothetical protein